jgi:hypothetical protein
LPPCYPKPGNRSTVPDQQIASADCISRAMPIDAWKVIGVGRLRIARRKRARFSPSHPAWQRMAFQFGNDHAEARSLSGLAMPGRWTMLTNSAPTSLS